MKLRALFDAWVCGACLIGAGVASGVLVDSVSLEAASAAQQQPARPAAAAAVAVSDDDVTLQAFLQRLEAIVRAGDAEGFVALEGPLGDHQDALAFAHAELRPGSTRVVVQERERQEVTLPGIPGVGYSLTVDAFIEYGSQARVATWQFFVRRAGESWGIVRQQVVSSVDNLFRLTLNAARQFDATNLTIGSEDLQLTLAEGTVFTVDTDRGITGLVLMGRGEMRFSPAPATERGQVRIFSGAEVLETKFDAAFIRVGTEFATAAIDT